MVTPASKSIVTWGYGLESRRDRLASGQVLSRSVHPRKGALFQDFFGRPLSSVNGDLADLETVVFLPEDEGDAAFFEGAQLGRVALIEAFDGEISDSREVPGSEEFVGFQSEGVFADCCGEIFGSEIDETEGDEFPAGFCDLVRIEAWLGGKAVDDDRFAGFFALVGEALDFYGTLAEVEASAAGPRSEIDGPGLLAGRDGDLDRFGAEVEDFGVLGLKPKGHGGGQKDDFTHAVHTGNV